MQEVQLLVPSCLVVAHIVGCLCEHFMYHHFRSKVDLVQEGAELLPCYDLCGMHMPLGRLIKHHRTARCDKNTHIRWWRRDVAIADKCSEATFSRTGEAEAECIEGV